MHNLHIAVTTAGSAEEAMQAVEALLAGWGDENNWSSVAGAVGEDGACHPGDADSRYAGERTLAEINGLLEQTVRMEPPESVRALLGRISRKSLAALDDSGESGWSTTCSRPEIPWRPPRRRFSRPAPWRFEGSPWPRPCRIDAPGKPPVREGKVTLPLLLALKRCTNAERDAIASVLQTAAYREVEGRDDDSLDLTPALEAVERYRGIADTIRRADEHAARAAAAIAPFPDGVAKRDLLAAAAFSVARDH